MKVHYFGTAFSLPVGDERTQGQEEQKMKMMISSCETWRSKEWNLVVGLRLCASRGRILWFVGSRLPIMVRGRLCPVSWSFYPLCSLPRGYWRSGMAPVLSP